MGEWGGLQAGGQSTATSVKVLPPLYGVPAPAYPQLGTYEWHAISITGVCSSPSPYVGGPRVTLVSTPRSQPG